MEYFNEKDPLTGSFHPDKVPYYTVKEVSDETGTHPQTIRRMVKEGGFQGVKFKGKLFVNQAAMDFLRSESPISNDRVGVIGTLAQEQEAELKPSQETIEDLL